MRYLLQNEYTSGHVWVGAADYPPKRSLERMRRRLEVLREAAEALALTQSKPSEEFEIQISHPIREKQN